MRQSARPINTVKTGQFRDQFITKEGKRRDSSAEIYLIAGGPGSVQFCQRRAVSPKESANAS